MPSSCSFGGNPSHLETAQILGMEAIFAVTVFAVVLVVIAAELVNRTVAALLGAAVVLSFGVVEQHEAAAEFVDWNTIGLLLGDRKSTRLNSSHANISYAVF